MELKDLEVTHQDLYSSASCQQVADPSPDTSTSSSGPPQCHGHGRPRGSINKHKRRGAYRSRMEASSR